MQYVRSISGSVSKTWNSINPATLSGAIDVIVVEQEDGSLACSPFHVRFGKFSLLRPFEKKVEFTVNDVKQDYAMKLGEGGEAFFVFETSAAVPANLQTSPVVSPASSPKTEPAETKPDPTLPEPEPLDLGISTEPSSFDESLQSPEPKTLLENQIENYNGIESFLSSSAPEKPLPRPRSGDWAGISQRRPSLERSATDKALFTQEPAVSDVDSSVDDTAPVRPASKRSASPPPVSVIEAKERALNLSKKLWSSKIPSHINDQGDLMLDMTGYKSSEEETLRAEVIARKILAEELEGSYDIGALIGADENGNLWIYSSEEAKEQAARRAGEGLQPFQTGTSLTSDTVSDPGYHSDDGGSETGRKVEHPRRDSDSAVSMSTPPGTSEGGPLVESSKNYAKTLRLTSDQLKALNLKPGANSMSFSVNRAVCQAYMYLWRYDTPIVISDIDGTITKSDALGHVLNMIGRDWTHLGVAKLYTDIVANGYNILYLTSRSVGQADTTRAYLNGVVQDGIRLPKGAVIMSPDRTIAALRREIYLRKPEVFKMACLRDIKSLFGEGKSPFYAGFGNRLTDALSYRSVNIPSTRIFTINSNAEVSMDLLSLNKYKTGYGSMREIVDHFFPPTSLLVKEGGEEFTDFTYWRDRPLDLADFSASESEDDEDDEDDGVLSRSGRADFHGADGLSEDEGDGLADSFVSRDFMEGAELGEPMISAEGNIRPESILEAEDEDEDEAITDDDEDEEVNEEGELANELDIEETALHATPLVKGQENEDLRTNLTDLAHALNSPAKSEDE